MKKFLLGTVGLLALGMAAPASAADLAARPYTKAPPPMIAPIYDWTGFYIGANGGWGQSRNCVDFVGVAGVVVADGCRERSGGLVGGQRLSLASQPVGVWPGSSGRLGGPQQPASQPPRSYALYSHQNQCHRPFHRPDRLCMECLAVLLQGRRGGDRQPL